MYNFWIADINDNQYDGSSFSFKDFYNIFPWVFNDDVRKTIPKAIDILENKIKWLNETTKQYFFTAEIMKKSTIDTYMGDDGTLHRLHQYRISINILDNEIAMRYKLTFDTYDPNLLEYHTV
jgi:hypothetical protein